MTRQHPILTYTNTLFYPLQPCLEEVKLEDIAHALSMLCRANGHFRRFYSVAQHSLNCAHEAKVRGLSPRVQLAALLHDASEAYLSDITRPVKACLPEYRTIEARLQQVIYEKFHLQGMAEEEQAQVTDIDNALLYYEFAYLHHQPLAGDGSVCLSAPDVTERRMTEVKAEFLQTALALQAMLQEYV